MLLSTAGIATGAQVKDILRPENVAVVVNEDSWASAAVANAYVHLRGIPERNVIVISGLSSFETIGVEEFRNRILIPVFSAIKARGLQGAIDCIAYSADMPFGVDLGGDIGSSAVPAWSGGRGSLTGMTYLHEAVLARSIAEYSAMDSNRYAGRTVAGEVPRFRSQTAWDALGMPVTNGAGRRYMLSTMLGATSGRGTSVREAVAALERAVAADGTCPTGTIYYTVSDDIRTRVRQWGFEEAVRLLKNEGVEAEIVKGPLPQGRGDIAGATVGTAEFDFAAAGSRILPGAIYDNLTSFGGILLLLSDQTPMTEFTRHGAAGVSGTVTEPGAIQAKFPTPFIHVYYARGASLAEAFYRSVAAPYQLLIVGDPLCRPWGGERRTVDTNTWRVVTAGVPSVAVPAEQAALPSARPGFRVTSGGRTQTIAGSNLTRAWYDCAGIKPGQEIALEGLVEVSRSDVYQFQVRSSGNAQVRVGGRALPATGRGSWQTFPVQLEAGVHEVHLRLVPGGDPGDETSPDLRFGATRVPPLVTQLRFRQKLGEVVRNMNFKGSVSFSTVESDPLSSRVLFAVDGLDKDADGTVAMEWKLPERGGWSIEPVVAESRVVKGVCEPSEFHVRYRGELFAPGTFFPLPVCDIKVRSTSGMEAGNSVNLPLDAMLKAQARPGICMPRIRERPEIDGKLDDAAWKGRATLNHLARPELDRPASQPAAVWLGWDDQCLYLAARCTEPELAALHLGARMRDGAVYMDDSIELFVSPDESGQPYYQFIINAAGVVYDGQGMNAGWNGVITSATGREDGAWTLEMAVPWATIGAQKPGRDTSLRILVVRNRVVGKAQELNAWPFVSGGSHQPNLFGKATFGN